MKKLSSALLFVLLTLAVQLASAQTIRRVNNNGITGTNIYATIQLAHDAAVSGDIIQVEPSTTSYGNLNCTKQLTFVGPGYFLSENQPPALQASVIPATVGQVVFTTGSNGTSMSGLITSTVYLGASNLIFQRNYVSNAYLYTNYNVATTNNVIRQNYIYGISYNTNTATTNLLITNNIIQLDVNVSGTGFTGEFSNNVALRNSNFDGFTVRNNYFGNNLSTTANTTWQYNLLGQATLPTLGSQSNNTANVPQSSVFVLTPTVPGQFDAWYKLKAGSPAIGTGQGGVDIGAYGSATGFAYRIAGIPAIPTIYQLSQSVSGNTLNVNVSTRSNN
ncbi:hypothetical protein GCM10022409_08340 [Hymenobacter glaciei]|uniref:Right handed beta helix domain-containing protein n=1 Tax=Hymenobacter glaciei TaxID=877209 RepID=A0ABP7TIC5_9BACT